MYDDDDVWFSNDFLESVLKSSLLLSTSIAILYFNRRTESRARMKIVANLIAGFK